MQADELDARAQLREHVRGLIIELRQLGVPISRLRNKNVLELEGMKLQELGACMRAPAGR